MNLKKRGLGRGLDALLADVSDKKTDVVQIVNDEISLNNPGRQADGAIMSSQEKTPALQSETAISLIKNIQRENLLLQQEAMEFKRLLEEFEQILQVHD